MVKGISVVQSKKIARCAIGRIGERLSQLTHKLLVLRFPQIIKTKSAKTMKKMSFSQILFL
jgi:hypothetical protein